MLVSLVLGVALGLVGGYYRGRFIAVVGWVSDLILILPSRSCSWRSSPSSDRTPWSPWRFWASWSHRRSTGWCAIDRKELYIDAAQVSGLSDVRIIGRHVLFAVRAPIVVHAATIAGLAIILQAGLEDLGSATPTPRHGRRMQDAFTAIYSDPLLMVWPGVAIGVTVGALILLGNVVRDSFNPQTHVRRRVGATKGQQVCQPLGDVTVPVDSICHVSRLTVGYAQHDGSFKEVVAGVGFDVRKGKVLGLVGESGSGKTQTSWRSSGCCRAEDRALRLHRFEGRDLLARRGEVGPWTPHRLHPAGADEQPRPELHDRASAHRAAPRREGHEPPPGRRTTSLRLLESVGIGRRTSVPGLPAQISGGMAQHVLIAGAMSCDPDCDHRR